MPIATNDVNDQIVLIDKPAGWTSFDVVAKIRGKIRADYRAQGVKPTKRQQKVGHAGTLDPFATGLLIVLLGDATKRAGEFLKLDKEYEATIRLGQTSTTGDPEGEITPVVGVPTSSPITEHSLRGEESRPWRSADGVETPVTGSEMTDETDGTLLPRDEMSDAPSLAQVEAILKQFVGEISQTPPAYSAIKIDGQRAYKLARKGQDFDIPSRQVTIHSLELLSYEYPQLKIRTHVSSGTYIRTLAEDIGAALGTGAYCSQLRRTTIGDFSLEDSRTVTDITG